VYGGGGRASSADNAAGRAEQRGDADEATLVEGEEGEKEQEEAEREEPFPSGGRELLESL
jgi:hypothetical protein